jgi:glucose dehydrogenase
MNRSVVAALTAFAVSAVASASRGLGGQPSAQPAGSDWRSYAGDLRNQHYSPLAQIAGSNFNALEVTWRFPERRVAGEEELHQWAVHIGKGR